MKLSHIKANPNNPRVIRDEKFQKLVNSIKEFPKMMALRPMVINQDSVVLGGNMRLKALKELGYKEIPNEWVKNADELTEDEQRRFIIADNVGFGEHDWEVLANEWDVQELADWGLDIPSFDVEENESQEDKEVVANEKLQERFIVPPFSVLDTRQGYWQDRKGYWKDLICDNAESRENLISDFFGTSILDPVLAEISNLWFGLEKCNAFDCFAGDSVFGYVSSYLGNNFTGIELRQEQADLNNERVKGFNAKYICDDGRNVLNHIEENSQDLLFSCPPYFDLEVYSDLPNDASNQKEYSDFLNILDVAFSNAIKCLKDNRFAVITIGDIRDKKGFYLGFVDDVKNIFKKNNVNLYNELILIETLGTLPQRVGRYMEHRKVGKCHQNVLIFYKGNPKKIKEIYPKIETDNGEEI